MKVLLKLFSLKFLAAILGVTFSILQIRYFGASRLIEIYFAAQSLVYIVTSLTQSGQLSEIFLPVYHQLNAIKARMGFKALNLILSRMLIFGLLLTVAVFFLTPYIIQLTVPGFEPSDQEFATLIFRVLLPYLLLQIINSFFINILNAEEKFGRAELLGLINSALNVLSLIVFFPYLGIWALVVSLLLGKCIEFLFYLVQLAKLGYKPAFIWRLEGFDHTEFFKAARSTVGYAVSTQTYTMVLTASISYLPEGSFAIFKYLQNLSSKIQNLVVQPFVTIFFTLYSKSLDSMDYLNDLFQKNMKSLLAINAFLIISIYLLGEQAIEVIWGGDKFQGDDVQLAYNFFQFNAIAILIGSINLMYRKMSVADGKGKMLYRYWTVSQLLSALFSYLLIYLFDINGLLFVIPMNVLLLTIATYIVYKKDSIILNFNYFDRDILILSALVFVAIFIQFYFEFEAKFSLEFFIRIFITTLLCSYPIYLAIKTYRKVFVRF
ncbi:hypothetical protein CW736_09235 [Nonlabens sp. MB-3u-79]|uniref:lipid II flippase MurJ n=1 Tax=Nonlabens sp. MB-3u-79 TaxID=2058134 RepID=UPI000C3027D5|nr:lipid II flippase MurJ [Nonlabens sp. MB-3u-79]AUC79541.1 hypothetical protein CW736_09235 [Nonlabens sp. MB-3u-79]